MKTAFVCDWLVSMRGGERCLEAACKLYPQADIYTLVHIKRSVSEIIESHKIYTSIIQNLPGSPEKFRLYLPFFAYAIGQFDLSGYGLILSFSHCVAKGVKAGHNVPHICYCHTPMRYAWHMREVYLSRLGRLKRLPASLVLDYLKSWDFKTANSVTRYIANSQNVRNRIRAFYHRDAEVIYPPVDCSRFTVSTEDEGYYLIVSAFVPYKRIDLAIEAFNNSNRKLFIIGSGPEKRFLEQISSRNIHFLGGLSDAQVTEYMQKCTALVFPPDEDFGIVPVEAQACGKAVIAFGKGGALETVISMNKDAENADKATGVFFYDQTPGSLRSAVELFEKNKVRFKPKVCRNNALKFDAPLFSARLAEYIKQIVYSGKV